MAKKLYLRTLLALMSFLLICSNAFSSSDEIKEIVSKLSGEKALDIGVSGLPGLIAQRFSDSTEIYHAADYLKSLYAKNGIQSHVEEYDPSELVRYFHDNMDETYREYFKSMIPMFEKDYQGFCDGTLDSAQNKKVTDRLARVEITKEVLCAKPQKDRVEFYITKTVEHTTSLTVDMLKKRALQTWPNLYAYLPARNADPSDPMTPLCVLGAHFDSVAREGGSRGPIVSPVVLAPGADDNGSGTAAIFLIAKQLKTWLSQHDSKCNFVIAHFSGEEEGLFGSLAFTRLHNQKKILWMMNIDMIGYNKVESPNAPKMNVGFSKTDSADLAKYFQLDKNFIDVVFVEKNDYIYSSDQISFWKVGVPALSISEQACSNEKCTDRFDFFNPNLHTTNDRMDIMNFEYADKIVNQTYEAILKAITL